MTDHLNGNERDDHSTNVSRGWLAVALTAAVATPLIASVAGFDTFVVARLAANHNEVGATDA